MFDACETVENSHKPAGAQHSPDFGGDAALQFPISPHFAQRRALMSWRDRMPGDAGVEWLEIEFGRAGHALVRYNSPGCYPAELGCAWPDVVHDRDVAYGWTAEISRASPPDSAEIQLLDEAQLIISAITNSSHRKLIYWRSMRYPLEPDRPIHSFRRIGKWMGVSPTSAERWFYAALSKVYVQIKSV